MVLNLMAAFDPLLTFRERLPMYAWSDIIGVDMRAYEPTDRVLIDLRDQRTDLAIRISLLKDRDQPDRTELSGLKRDLELLDRRIAKHRIEPSVKAFTFDPKMAPAHSNGVRVGNCDPKA